MSEADEPTGSSQGSTNPGPEPPSVRLGRWNWTDVLSQAGADTSGGLLDFGSAIASDQLWFTQGGDDLTVSVIGTSDSVTIDDFFVAGNREVTQLTALWPVIG